MLSEDLVAAALRRPMDWGQFEILVTDLLRSDDMPAIRKLGGRHDSGLDAKDESYYECSTRFVTVVQITSQRAQEDKVEHTIQTLAVNEIEYDRLVMVFRDPVSSTVQAQMRSHAHAREQALEIRDESYLIGQLSRPESGVFHRYFGDAQDFLNTALAYSSGLPAQSPLERGILASACAFGELRLPALDHIVIATLAAADEGLATFTTLLASVRSIVPHLMKRTLRESLTRLAGKGLCRLGAENARISAAHRAGILKSTSAIERQLDRSLAGVVEAARSIEQFDDAAEGRSERNLRRTLSELARTAGPIPGDKAREGLLWHFSKFSDQFWGWIGEGLNNRQRDALVTSLQDFLGDVANAGLVASLVRTYAVASACHLDPTGRTYSSRYFQHKPIYLDTDAIITALIADLPESEGIRAGLRALAEAESRLIVLEPVLEEVALHFDISDKTFTALPDLKAYPPSIA